jgi:hypothetical protein
MIHVMLPHVVAAVLGLALFIAAFIKIPGFRSMVP